MLSKNITDTYLSIAKCNLKSHTKPYMEKLILHATKIMP